MLSPALALDAVGKAFGALASGDAVVQRRVRTAVRDVKLSTMGAVLPALGVAGAKVYTTVGGTFAFVVLLFSSETGEPLAVVEADGFTAVRTAAVTALAAQHLARAADTLALFGTGVQSRAHAVALSRVLNLNRILVVSRGDAADFCAEVEALTACPAVPATAGAAVAEAGVVVTATRSATPVFDGRHLAEGALVAAVGSTLPNTAEIDGETVRRATRVVVEWLPQAREEAGELQAAVGAGVLQWEDVAELGAIVSGRAPGRLSAADIIVFDSVGIGLEDVAVAAALFREAMGG